MQSLLAVVAVRLPGHAVGLTECVKVTLYGSDERAAEQAVREYIEDKGLLFIRLAKWLPRIDRWPDPEVVIDE